MTDGTNGPPTDEIRELRLVRGMLSRSSELGFLGGMAIEDQIEHAQGFRFAVEESLGTIPSSVADLGTGGGIPGLVLAADWPMAETVLIDANERRTQFLQHEVQDAGWESRIEVVRTRAEEAGHDPRLTGRFGVVVARSFGAPAVTAECGAPLLTLEGILVVSEPPDEDAGTRWDSEGLEVLGLVAASSYRHQNRYGYQVIRKVKETPERFPRRIGVPAKRPLF